MPSPNTQHLTVYAEARNYRNSVDIQMTAKTMDGELEFFCLKPVEVIRVAQGECAPPAISLTMKQAQQLMDELWSCGIRPTEGSGSAGSLAATERHLKDMQTIAFSALKKVGALEQP